MNIEDFGKDIFCILCLDLIHDEYYGTLCDVSRQILEFLLIPIGVDDQFKHHICNLCFNKMLAAFNFKAQCFIANSMEIPYGCRIVLPVGFGEVYINKIVDNLSLSLAEGQRICQLCLMVIEDGITTFEEVEEDIFCTYIPEIDFEDIVVCKNCLHSVIRNGNFVKTCIDIQEEVTPEKSDAEMNGDESLKYTCNHCDFKSAHGSDLMKHMLEHKNSSEAGASHSKSRPNDKENSRNGQLYECEACEYKTKLKKNFKKHLILHRNPSKIQRSLYNKCNSKSKSELKIHMLQYRACSDIKWQSKMEENTRNRHMPCHKASVEINYKCDTCDYKANLKGNMKNHVLSVRNSI